MRRAALLFVAALPACDVLESEGGQPLPLVAHYCPPVSSSVAISTGDVLTTGIRNLTVDNGIVRIRYGAHVMDHSDQGSIVEIANRHMDHVLAGRHVDAPEVSEADGCVSAACHNNGSHWHDAMSPQWGDGVKYSSGEPKGDANRVRVLLASSQEIELAYEWDEIRLDGLRAPNVCQLGRYPNCGPTAKNGFGFSIYNRDGETLQSVRYVKVWKTVRVQRCLPGYFVSLRSDPPLSWAEQGPRTVRLNYLTSIAAWSCDGSAIARHPSAGAHVPLGTTNCIADVPVQRTGHDSWPFARFMLTQSPTAFSSLQYSPTQLGSPGTFDLWDHVGLDGRPAPWQAFIGAIAYESADPAAEPSPEAMDAVRDVADQVPWP